MATAVAEASTAAVQTRAIQCVSGVERVIFSLLRPDSRTRESAARTNLY
jgi:hypothetical protein